MRTITYSTIPVPTAIKTAGATATSVQTFTGASLNGAIGQGVMNPPRSVSVTTSTSSGSYIAGSTVVITGLDQTGLAQVETLTLTQTGGGETLVGVKQFSQVTKIVVAAQTNTSGTVAVGVQDVRFHPQSPPIGLIVNGTGNLKLGFADGSTDILLGVVAGMFLPISPVVIYGDANTTATKITAVLP